MIDPALTQILLTTFAYGVCGSFVAVVMQIANRQKPKPRFDQAAAVGFLIGAAFGAFFAIFQAMLVPQ